MNRWWHPDHDLARIRLLGWTSGFVRKLEIAVNRFMKRGANLFHTFTMEPHEILNTGEMTDETAIFIAVFDSCLVTLVTHRFHGFTPANSRNSRASRSA